ncbi:MAG: DUF433 domain-containing protein [Gammaproteobacteria bacterium]|nr:DUF433 domain-containing protein [Gammaproteobacteria bacterium]
MLIGKILLTGKNEEIREGYPDITREDIQQAIEYAAWLTEEQVHAP